MVQLKGNLGLTFREKYAVSVSLPPEKSVLYSLWVQDLRPLDILSADCYTINNYG